VDALLAALPTAEEVALVQAEDGPGVVWDRPEQLVLAVGAVEQAEARLKCWQLRGTFQERLDSVGRGRGWGVGACVVGCLSVHARRRRRHAS
jgi:hypothetical protein